MKPVGNRRVNDVRMSVLVAASVALLGIAPVAGSPERPASPNILLITVDTLRADRIGSYGCERPITPNLDRLIEGGVKFSKARTVEPLTAPALCSMLTGLYPHEHGASRNGLRMRSGLASLPKTLQAHGYRTAAFAGNWTLRDKLTGLAEHFEYYEEVLSRRRWLGLIRGEATARDLTTSARQWLSNHLERRPDQPFFLWVHYVEPHGPYRLHREFLPLLNRKDPGSVSKIDRYDTEVAFVDASIGNLLDSVKQMARAEDTIVAFTADHGESLGEHGYWGHGRHLYEATLRIPMSITWPGHIEPGDIEAPALITDLPSTLLGLIDRAAPASFGGFDWTGVLDREEQAPANRITHYEAHRGAVISRHDSVLARRAGLLEVGIIVNQRKEIFRVERQRRRVYNLLEDGAELNNLATQHEEPSEGLLDWMRSVYAGLTSFEDTPPEPLDEESIEQMRSLGYVD